MLSNPYSTKGTARSAAKIFAQENAITKIALALDIEERVYFFTDELKGHKDKMIIFARYELVKGKWREKPLFGKEKRRKAT